MSFHKVTVGFDSMIFKWLLFHDKYEVITKVLLLTVRIVHWKFIRF